MIQTAWDKVMEVTRDAPYYDTDDSRMFADENKKKEEIMKTVMKAHKQYVHNDNFNIMFGSSRNDEEAQ